MAWECHEGKGRRGEAEGLGKSVEGKLKAPEKNFSSVTVSYGARKPDANNGFQLILLVAM